ncbi:MAG: carbon-nitrogen hydrolase family protein [Bryobacteraceae bacterium]|nr:carbon-nitrogen hydrolase family protein [Bryobacteraceae bacterium]
MKALALLLASAAVMAAEPIPIEPANWRLWSHRPATAPRAYLDPLVSRGQGASLAVSGNSNAIAHGGWEQTVSGLKADTWYRFTAWFRHQGVQHPVWQIVPKLDWRNAAGKRAGQPDYVYLQKQEGDWTRTWIEVKSPQDTAAVAVQLLLSHAPGGTVWWDSVSLEQIPEPKQRKARIASINLRPAGLASREANVEAFIHAAEKAAPAPLDMLLFPEGMTVVGTGKPYTEVAESIPGPTSQRLGELARKRNAWVAAGIYEAEGGAVYNTAILIDRQGRLAGKYRKVYLPREEYESGLTPGNTFPVFDTDFGRIGLMICYDVFYSDPARALAAQGAEIILLPIWGGDETLAKARAIENRVFLVTSGYNHPTYIMDPDGERVSVAQQRGDAAIATLDLNRRYLPPFLGDMKGRRMKELRTDVVIPPPKADR